MNENASVIAAYCGRGRGPHRANPPPPPLTGALDTTDPANVNTV